MITTHIFQNGDSQTLRIPQELRTDAEEYYINKVGDIIVAYPVDDPA